VDESSVSGLPGVLKVIVKNDFVGIVAEKLWQAIQAANSLTVTWSQGTGLPSQRGFYDHLRNHPSRRSTYVVNSDDVDAKLSSAVTVLESTYLHPYQMHGSIGSSCAVADVRGNTATIWSATQAVYPLRDTTAMVLGLRPENIRVIFVRGSGCYGINGADPVSYDAALMSQSVGRPVRVQLSREDEMAWGESYGPPYVIDQRVGVDFANRANGAPSYVTGRVGQTAGGTGIVAGQRVLQHVVPSPFFTGPVRSAPLAQPPSEHVCARVVHGRDRGAREGGSGRVSPTPPR
jgi:xanthine dehydrogenase molybdopterin-binding subunit B